MKNDDNPQIMFMLGEITQSVKNTEKTLTDMKNDIGGIRKEVDDLNLFRSNVKGKVAGFSLIGGVVTSTLFLWVKSYFTHNN